MITLQGMADHRFTSVSLSTNVFLGEIIYLRPSLPLNAKNCCGLLEVLWKGLAARAAIPKKLQNALKLIVILHQGKDERI